PPPQSGFPFERGPETGPASGHTTADRRARRLDRLAGSAGVAEHGRRAGFRFLWGQPRGGSNPLARTSGTRRWRLAAALATRRDVGRVALRDGAGELCGGPEGHHHVLVLGQRDVPLVARDLLAVHVHAQLVGAADAVAPDAGIGELHPPHVEELPQP